MKHLWLTAYTDIIESLRARWFMIYSMVFGGIVVLLFAFGLSESRIMGFTGLSRLLVTYIQLSMAILPVFVLITTVRSVAGDREAGVFEYMLSLPVTLGSLVLGAFFWAFFCGFSSGFSGDVGCSWLGGRQRCRSSLGFIYLLHCPLMSLAWCFLGIGMLISTLARSSDVAQGAAFLIWLLLLLFLDLILLGVMIQEQLPPETAVAIALANPMQVFRTATMMLFDPQLVLLGPTAFLILDNFSQAGYMAYAIALPNSVW